MLLWFALVGLGDYVAGRSYEWSVRFSTIGMYMMDGGLVARTRLLVAAALDSKRPEFTNSIDFGLNTRQMHSLSRSLHSIPPMPSSPYVVFVHARHLAREQTMI